MTDERTVVLRRLDELVPTLLADAARFVRLPSVSGTPAEQAAQVEMAQRLREGGLEVDEWEIDLATLAGDPEFPP